MSLEGELFHIDPLATTVGLCIIFFTILTLLYSSGFMAKVEGLIRYYAYILLTLVTALGVVFAANLILLLACWGLTGVLLYLLIGYGVKERTSATAKKAFLVIGGADAFMLLGVALVDQLSGSLNIQDIRLNPVSFEQPLAIYAFVCLLVGVLAKSGAIPLHTWLVDTVEDAPTPVTVFLPVSVDKLLGIYLLARMGLDLFVMTSAMYTVLLVIGAATIVGAGMMMLIQQDLKRVLGYCAVSQVGYIFLGIGSGNPVGIAGGLFHVVNHAIYKSCLFFSSGVVEQKTQTTDLEQLGGMARQAPVIFVTFLIAALSVSSVPPLNGFVSKWMVYQGIIESGKGGGAAWLLWLTAAMFGSTLTLAGMMRLVHATFLGQPAVPHRDNEETEEKTPVAMVLPPILLALLCLLFGIWAYAVPLRYLILPILAQPLVFLGMWQPTLATVLILVGLGLGVILYVLGRVAKSLRQTDSFIGGETLDVLPEMRVSGSAFYNTIQELPLLRSLYTLAQKGTYDPYVIGAKTTLSMHRVLRALHTGVLSHYLSWCLLGMGILFYVLLFR